MNSILINAVILRQAIIFGCVHEFEKSSLNYPNALQG